MRRAYENQRAGAKRRGIEWGFTFDSWVAWWGADIDRRGTGHGMLCMMRVADSGAYSPDNCRKGDAGDNARTRGLMARKRTADRAKAEREARLNALMWAPSLEPYDPPKVAAPLAQSAFGRAKRP